MKDYGQLSVTVADVKGIYLPKEIVNKRFIEYYVQIYMGSNMETTEVKEIAEWNQMFTFDFNTQNRLDFFLMAVHDQGETFIGCAEIGLQSLRDVYQTLELEETQLLYNVSINSGELRLLLTYTPNLPSTSG